MAAHAFISYSSLDSRVAEAVCEALEAAGNRCWIAPRDISPSKEWAEEIIGGINVASVMVLVLSSSSNGSPQVHREVERAVHKRIPVIVFRVENIEPTGSLEYFLSSQHWFDAYSEPVEAHLPRLGHLIETLRQGGQSGPEPAYPAAIAGDPHEKRRSASPPSAPGAFPDADLNVLEAQLANHIGPIARILTRKAAAVCKDLQSLLETLANELDSPAERAAFLSACRQRLRR